MRRFRIYTALSECPWFSNTPVIERSVATKQSIVLESFFGLLRRYAPLNDGVTFKNHGDSGRTIYTARSQM